MLKALVYPKILSGLIVCKQGLVVFLLNILAVVCVSILHCYMLIKTFSSSLMSLGYALIPSTKSDNFSDSSHSEISSRSSIVSNCSVDSMSAALQDERSLSQSLIVVDSGGAERKEHPQALTDYGQPCPG